MADVDEFTPIPEAVPPPSPVYLVREPDRGDDLANRTPNEALPAIWISNGIGRDGADHRDAPKIGWCWAGNRHTWLGFASAAVREPLRPSG